MRTETKCPKCGGFDGYEQIKNVVKGSVWWFLRGSDVRVLFCRNCDVEMIEYEVIIPDKPDDPKQTIKYILIFIGTLVGLILLTAVFN